MNKVAQIIGGISVVVAGSFTTPVVPEDMQFLYAYQAPTADILQDVQTYETKKGVVASSSPEKVRVVTEEPVYFPDTDGNGLTSVAVFASAKTNDAVFVKMSDEQYSDMGLNSDLTGKGKWSNPKKQEYLTLWEALSPRKAKAAIAYDASSSAQTAVNATSLTFAHTTSGSDRLLALSATAQDCGTSRTVTAKYNGTSMTLHDTEVYIPVICPRSKLYAFYLINPSTGSNNIVISTTGSATRLAGAAASYTGVNTADVIDAGAKKVQAGATSITLAHTVVDSNTWGISWALAYNGNCPNLSATNSLVSIRACQDDMVSIGDSNGTVSTGSQTFGMGQTNPSLTTMINATINAKASVAVPDQTIFFD